MLNSSIFGSDKMLKHLDRIASWQAGKLPPPVTVEIQLTNACNHACPGCSFSYLVFQPGPKDSMPYDVAEHLVSQLAAMGVRAVTISGGGEPLAWGESRVVKLLRHARSLGMDTALITNGSLLRDFEFLSICEWVRVSLDAYDGETFQRFHGRSEREFAKVVANLRIMGREAKRRKSHNEKCATLGVGFLTQRDSVEANHFWKMAEFCAGIDGLDYLQFRPLVQSMAVDATLKAGWESFTKDELRALRHTFGEAAAMFGREDFHVLASEGKYEALSQPAFGRKYDRCLGHFLEAVVAADCKVYHCCHGAGQEKFCLGDLRENTFAEIWHSERAKAVYESFDPRDTCSPACRLHLQNNVLHDLGQPTTHKNFI